MAVPGCADLGSAHHWGTRDVESKSNDYLLCQELGSGDYNSVNRNTFVTIQPSVAITCCSFQKTTCTIFCNGPAVSSNARLLIYEFARWSPRVRIGCTCQRQCTTGVQQCRGPLLVRFRIGIDGAIALRLVERYCVWKRRLGWGPLKTHLRVRRRHQTGETSIGYCRAAANFLKMRAGKHQFRD